MTVVEHFCEVGGGVRLCYRTSGDPGGEPILLVAGLGQQLHSWPPELCDALAAQGHLVVRFDNRDTGRSWRSPHPAPRPQQLLLRRFAPAQYTLADMAGDTAGLIDALGLHSAHLVGASMGAMIAQSTAARHPGRV
ncbi:MAG: alpha/beta fold hydrolase, partial [Acidobacteriota bacterium]|nr:alpha/beta fold hydrolase [Acidobacteriota bacterium]